MASPSHPLDELAAHAVGALERTEAEALEAHLAACPACRTELATHHGALARLTPDEAPPAHLWLRIRAAVTPGPTVASVTVALAGVTALVLAGP